MASDFAGFNLYIHTNKNLTNALLNEKGGYPTIPFSTHARSNITLTFPTNANPQNNTLYYVSVTAYGTNDLAEGGKIETRINAIIPVIPRAEATNAVSGTNTNGNRITGKYNPTDTKPILTRLPYLQIVIILQTAHTIRLEDFIYFQTARIWLKFG